MTLDEVDELLRRARAASERGELAYGRTQHYAALSALNDALMALDAWRSSLSPEAARDMGARTRLHDIDSLEQRYSALARRGPVP